MEGERKGGREEDKRERVKAYDHSTWQATEQLHCITSYKMTWIKAPRPS